MEIVMPLVDRAIVLDLGKVLVEGKPHRHRARSESDQRLSWGSSCCRCMKSPPPIRGWSRSRRSRIEVAKGEIVCVAGANGAGKSTLLKSIAGAERPRSGTVTFDGARIDGIGAARDHARAASPMCRKTAGCFRGCRCATICGSAVTSIAASPTATSRWTLVFKLFPRLSERLEQRAETLSGGEQQMLAIGRALMTRPRLSDAGRAVAGHHAETGR